MINNPSSVSFAAAPEHKGIREEAPVFVSSSLLPLWEKVLEERMRGTKK